MEDIAGRIEREVASWPGVTTHAHRFGGIEFRLGRREIGHLHGERWADLPFQKGIRDMLVETGRAQPHHVLPETGWVSRQIRSDEDVAEVIELFRLSYERARVAQNVRESRGVGRASRLAGRPRGRPSILRRESESRHRGSRPVPFHHTAAAGCSWASEAYEDEPIRAAEVPHSAHTRARLVWVAATRLVSPRHVRKGHGA